jgi:hypothetical protein
VYVYGLGVANGVPRQSSREHVRYLVKHLKVCEVLGVTWDVKPHLPRCVMCLMPYQEAGLPGAVPSELGQEEVWRPLHDWILLD